MVESQEKTTSLPDLQNALKGAFQEFSATMTDEQKHLGQEQIIAAFEEYIDEKYGIDSEAKETLDKIRAVLGRNVQFSDFAKLRINATETLAQAHRSDRLATAQNNMKWGVYQACFEHYEKLITVPGKSAQGFTQYVANNTDLPLYDKKKQVWSWRGEKTKIPPQFDQSLLSDLESAKGLYVQSIQKQVQEGTLVQEPVEAMLRSLKQNPGPTISRISTRAEQFSTKASDTTLQAMIETTMRSDIKKLIETQRQIEIVRIVNNEVTIRQYAREYFGAQGGNCNRLLNKKYPAQQFLKTRQGQFLLENRDPKAYEQAYYRWIEQSAQDAKRPQEVQLAQAMQLICAGKTAELTMISRPLGKIVMKQLHEQTTHLADAIGFGDKFERLLASLNLGPETAASRRQAYESFKRSLFDPEITRHTLTALDGEQYVLHINKELAFDPQAVVGATNPAALFTLNMTYLPGEHDGTEELMQLINRQDVWSNREPIRLRDKATQKPGKEAPLIASQRYLIRDAKGAQIADGRITMDVQGKEDGKEPVWTIAVHNPETGTVTHPFGEKPTTSPFDLLQDCCFEPVGPYGFRQELTLGGDLESDYAQHMKDVETATLALMVQNRKKPEGNYLPETHMQGMLEQYKLEAKSFLQAKIVGADDIPEALLASTTAVEVHAWIDNGKIFLNGDYFATSHGMSRSDLEQFLDNDGYIDSFAVKERVHQAKSPQERQKRALVYTDLKRRTVHEKAHRVFDYYGLEDSADLHDHHEHEHTKNSHLEADGDAPIVVTSIDGVNVPISNELLSKIAEVSLLFGDDAVISELRQRMGTTAMIESLNELCTYRIEGDDIILQLPIVVGGQETMHEVSLYAIEDAIQQKIGDSTFTFAKLEDLDSTIVLGELSKDEEKRSFYELLEASASTFGMVQANQLDKAEILKHPNTLYIYGSNESDYANANNRGDNINFAGLENTLPIRMGRNASTGSRFTDVNFGANEKALIDEDIKAIKQWIKDKEAAGITPTVMLPIDDDGDSMLGFDFGARRPDKDPNDDSYKVVDYVHQKLGKEIDSKYENTKKAFEDEKAKQQDKAKQQEPEPKDPARELEYEQNQAEFDEIFKQYEGDDSIGSIKPGVVLYMRDGISNRPGKNSDWVKVTVVGVADDAIKLEITGHTERILGSAYGYSTEIPRTAEGAKRLKRAAKGKIFKYRQKHSKSEFLDYAKEIPMPDGRGGVDQKGNKKYFANDTEFKGKVTHVGALPNQGNQSGTLITAALYRVAWRGSDVEIYAVTDMGESEAHQLDYTSFLQFVKDKGLNPFTQTEVDRYGKIITPEAKDTGTPKTGFWDKFVSIASVVVAGKNLYQSFKDKIAQSTEVDVINAEKGLMSLVPGGLDIVDDIKSDLDNKQDAMIMKTIEKYKKQASQEDDGDGVHGKKASQKIEREVFAKYSTKREFRYKSAGYLLYALDQGHPYFRNLAKYHGDGIWVRNLLGYDYQEMYLEQKQQKIDELRSKGTPDNDMQNAIAKMELMFIKHHTTDHPLYGSRFGRKVESGADKWGAPDTISNKKSGAEAKGNPHDIYEMIKNGGILNMSPSTYIGGLQGLEGAVESPEHYKIFYSTIIMGIVTGYTRSFSVQYMNEFKSICRRRGIPIGMLADDPFASEKVTALLDYIGQESGAPHSFSQTVKKKVPGRNPRNVHADNFVKSAKGVVGGFEQWWDHNGESAIAAFNYQEDFLIKGLVKNPGGVTGDAINVYFSDRAVYNSYRDYRDTSQMPDGDSPFFDGVLNLAPGTFESYMLSFQGGRFRYNQSYEMRQKFDNSMQSFKEVVDNTDPENKEEFLEFLMKKFKLFFGKKLGSDGMEMLEYEIMEGHKYQFDGRNRQVKGDSKTNLSESLEKIAGNYIYGENRYQVETDEIDGAKYLVQKSKSNNGNFQELKESVVKDGVGTMMEAIGQNLLKFEPAKRAELIKKTWGM